MNLQFNHHDNCNFDQNASNHNSTHNQLINVDALNDSKGFDGNELNPDNHHSKMTRKEPNSSSISKSPSINSASPDIQFVDNDAYLQLNNNTNCHSAENIANHDCDSTSAPMHIKAVNVNILNYLKGFDENELKHADGDESNSDKCEDDHDSNASNEVHKSSFNPSTSITTKSQSISSAPQGLPDMVSICSDENDKFGDKNDNLQSKEDNDHHFGKDAPNPHCRSKLTATYIKTLDIDTEQQLYEIWWNIYEHQE